MKRTLLLITVYIVVIAYAKGQTFSFVTYYTTGKEEGSEIEYDFKIEIDKKNIKEQPGGIFNIDIPYYKTYFTDDFISFGLKEGSVLPKGITEYDRCSHFFAISKVTGIMTLKFDNNDNKYEFVPKELIQNALKDLPGLLNRIDNLKKSLSGNSKSSLTNSPSEQIKAEGEFPIPSNNFKQMTKEDLESYAKRGIAEAQYELGNRIFDNSNWKNEEVEMAKYWFGKAVEQSHPQAHLKLGFIYSGQAYWLYNNEGPNHEAYKKIAFDIYLKGAKLGEINCQMWVGEYYHNGRYAPKNEKQALYWTRKAAEQGQEAAKRHLKEWGY